MPELRIVLTVLPVGPRGTASLVAGGQRWFAVQIAAGFDQAPAKDELDNLWPWALHVVQSGNIELTGWLLDPAGASFDLQAAVPTEEIDFQAHLRGAIQGTYSTPASRKDLDLTLRLPGDANAQDPQHQRQSFPARVQYLATLPGEMALRLLATVYVEIDVDKLFHQAGGVWTPNGKTLWIAPKLVGRPGHNVTLTGSPVLATPGSPLFKVGGVDGGLNINAYGPGCDLNALASDEKGPIFDLTSYWLTVGAGDRRFAQVETLLLAALDPFAELGDLTGKLLSEQISLTGGTAARAIPADVADALLDLWQVQALAAELATTKDAVNDLARRLLAPGQALPAIAPVPASLQIDSEFSAEDLAPRLGITGTTPRERLQRVAARAGFQTVAAWLAQTFDAVLAASDPQVVAELITRWRFGESTTATIAERRLALARTVIDDRRESRDALPLLAKLAVAGTSTSEDHLRDAASETLTARWTDGKRLEEKILGQLGELGLITKETLKLTTPKALVAAHLDNVWKTSKDERPELPGRGLALVVGPENQRLVHEDDQDLVGNLNGIYGEIAGVSLLGRRGKDAADLASRPWRLVTGGAALAGPLGDRLFDPTIDEKIWLHELLAIPLRPAFQQGVARADVEYHGQPMLAQSPLAHAYAAEDYATGDPGGLEAAYSFQALGGVASIAAMTEAAKTSRAPVLRYGDAYEFQAALVDQAGGLPKEIADAQKPWKLDVGRLATVQLPPNPAVLYPRTVPVGEINLLPALDPKTTKREWPALPGDVFLRSRETWSFDHHDADSLPVLLLSQNGHLTGTLSGYAVTVLPPAIDEHTLLGWAVPALDDPDPATTRQKLLDALTSILEARQQRGSAERTVPVHDPAVAALGVRIHWFGPDNTETKIVSPVVTLADGTGPFEKKALTLNVAAAAIGAAPAITVTPERIDAVVPEGSFATVELWPLVKKADFMARFAGADLFKDLVDADALALFPDHVAFRPSVLLAESATDHLPDANDLWKNLALAEQNGAVAVSFAQPVADLAFVDRFAIERERWVWRNRPVVTAELSKSTGDERLRLAASGPPDDLFDEKTRDQDQGPVAAWERIADIDRGFVDRGDVSDRWPRQAHADASAGGVQLFLDDRDAMTAADFLRYGLRVRSRYAGVLPADLREKEAMGPQQQTRRRIAVGFRGQKVKPLKILAVVPLTRPLEQDPLASKADAPPFLVLLDETFFREYGIGERLEARLSLESLDIGEDPATQLPYRTGPLPDHWLKPGEPLKPEDERLDVFGPFGYSLDTSPAEALANATAFVVYPPAKVQPHSAMFARFRRVLDKPSPSGQQSDPSDTYALYTLPDSTLLARSQQAPGGPEPTLEAVLGAPGAASFVPRGLQLLLDPLTAPGKGGTNSEAASQYRYFLLVSRLLHGAGQALDVELPEGLWRLKLFDPKNGFQKKDTFRVELGSGTQISAVALKGGGQTIEPGGAYRARVIEVLLNGRYQGLSPLDDEGLDWRDFWKRLLYDKSEAPDSPDAAGMVRRVSDAFTVRA